MDSYVKKCDHFKIWVNLFSLNLRWNSLVVISFATIFHFKLSLYHFNSDPEEIYETGSNWMLFNTICFKSNPDLQHTVSTVNLMGWYDISFLFPLRANFLCRFRALTKCPFSWSASSVSSSFMSSSHLPSVGRVNSPINSKVDNTSPVLATIIFTAALSCSLE